MDAHASPPSTAAAVARFVAGTLVAIAVVLVGGFFALKSVTTKEAERNTRDQVQSQGRLVESSGLTDGVLHGDQRSLDKLDDVVLGQVLSPSIVRVKVWSQDGRVLYSDEPALIGKRFGLGEDELALFRRGGARAEVSDLSKPENRYERQESKLLEAHTTIRTPNGAQVLFEIYQRFGSVSASAERLLRALAPPLLGGLLVLLAFQLPLAWSMARRLQRGHSEREMLLTNAIEASSQERRRIAADLHDGVVQDLAGVAFGLAPLADDAKRRGDGHEAGVLQESIATLRRGQRGLRTLLVEIHPPSLDSAGLEVALSDLLSPLEAEGMTTELHVDDGTLAGSERDALIYRVAREALRNVKKHADARSVRMDVTVVDGGARLVVADDGRGFSSEDRDRRADDGHVGMTLLQDLVGQSGGRLSVRSVPGQGTTVELEVPS